MIELFLVTEDDLRAIKEIYDYYILNSTATFHCEPITINELKEFVFINHPKYPSFLIKENGVILGYCFLTRHKKRQAYDRTAELSIYLKPEWTGRGIGQIAIDYLEKAAIKAGIHVLIGTLSGENEASIKLFEKVHYKKVGHLKSVGEKFGRIIDVMLYEKEV